MYTKDEEALLKQYRDYAKSYEATIVFIVRDSTKIDTTDKWIDVISFDSYGEKCIKYNKEYKYCEKEAFLFNYIMVELFDKKMHPKYPKDASVELKRAITWETAHADIKQQRTDGVRGPMFLATCPLINKNRGKKETKYFNNWNDEYGGFDHTGKVPTTTIAREVDMEPEWAYLITSSRRINDKQKNYILSHYNPDILPRINKEKRVSLDWFFETSIK